MALVINFALCMAILSSMKQEQKKKKTGILVQWIKINSKIISNFYNTISYYLGNYKEKPITTMES